MNDQLRIFENKETGAVISDCGKYRYQLFRIWNEELPKILFIMLNPSKADQTDNDPTMNRCIKFAKLWGFGGLYVVNLFAYRSTDPEGLFGISDPVGPENKFYIDDAAMKCKSIVCAWGNGHILKKLKGKIGQPLQNLVNLHYIELSIHGVPKHPLFLEKVSFLRPFYKDRHGDWGNSNAIPKGIFY